MTTWNDDQIEALLRELRLAPPGTLVAAIVRDAASGDILMLGYQNDEAVRLTFRTGIMHYYSRSRGRLWMKGETSGHVQHVRRVRVDCDGDAVLYDVEQVGPGACHTGHRSCFYREATGPEWREVEQAKFNPDKVYKA